MRPAGRTAFRSSGHGTVRTGSRTAARSCSCGPSCATAAYGSDTWGYEILAELEPRAEDWFIAKSRLSSFFQTNLELVLRGLGAETVLITGVLTNQCIGATCKDALFRDFKPIVVEEATGTTLPHLHEPAIEMMRVGWGQVNTLERTLGELAAFPVALAEA